MNVTINILELACELAEEKLHENWTGSIKIFEDEDENGDIRYTEEAQDIFNELYDKYYSLIENLKLN